MTFNPYFIGTSVVISSINYIALNFIMSTLTNFIISIYPAFSIIN